MLKVGRPRKRRARECFQKHHIRREDSSPRQWNDYASRHQVDNRTRNPYKIKNKKRKFSPRACRFEISPRFIVKILKFLHTRRMKVHMAHILGYFRVRFSEQVKNININLKVRQAVELAMAQGLICRRGENYLLVKNGKEVPPLKKGEGVEGDPSDYYNDHPIQDPRGGSDASSNPTPPPTGTHKRRKRKVTSRQHF